ncbi:restriction endonuclease [Bacillus cereus]|uniref:Restriction endonuclease n=3 Tax=Bacillus cereus group TaxID=86661 RepID=A0AAW5L7F8_BACCE|nr:MULTISPECIES: restriction endonuclease [Bacillus cereus group]MCQ6287890.1 restriction endonuclease [Bacillus cereus]MCQ6307177.1 restriction endonuclease [Bacillus cereus]MCQ6315493.1 restriction endonuclease [Bacillus cereus]MCQ6341299.1 restriction endonuclease [Bacillus cereus]MCQ6382616.1 restriction endonuclease [Bacillus cereus]
MSFFTIVLLFITCISVINWVLLRRKKEHDFLNLLHLANNDVDFKKTVAMGLYYRFMKQTEEEKVSNVFIREDPIAFEHFVGDVFERYYGGSVYVTRGSNDYGVDFEHKLNDELYIGQVKCYNSDMPFNAIALVHSNMVKEDAKGGYVVTTGSYTVNAQRYAEGLNIQLIDGPKLAEMYIEVLQNERNPVYKLDPVNN